MSQENSSPAISSTAGLADPRIQETLQRLHRDARGDWRRMMRVIPSGVWALLRRRSLMQAISPTQMKHVYIPVSREQGEFLYVLAHAAKAQRIVEFGASFGISTVYLAAAARDTGGRVVTTEIEPTKCKVTRDNLCEAGLSDYVDVLEGDALQTLAPAEGERSEKDLLFLDGWKDLYLPLLKVVEPRLADHAVIVADNVNLQDARPYLDRVRAPNGGFVSATLFNGAMEVSCVVRPTRRARGVRPHPS